jgi:hypothetical protein
MAGLELAVTAVAVVVLVLIFPSQKGRARENLSPLRGLITEMAKA